MTRKPCVAGRFYPDEPALLQSAIDTFLVNSRKERAIAIIAPHAGYVYSGAIAGKVYASVNIPDAVILIGPNHTGLGERAAIMPKGVWEMPLGRVKINEKLSGALLDSSGLFSADSAAHLMEHSLEVQLPFIFSLNKNASIVPLTVMHAREAECAEMGASIAKAVAAYGKDVLIVVSSDMNHYDTDALTREKDRLAIEEVLKLDPMGLLKVTARRDISMCGVIPAAIAITAAKRLGAKTAKLIKYSTSGEASGDFSKVVGYAGIIIQ